MVKTELEQRSLLKACYGTNEWSANSGICSNCKWQKDCGKFKGNLKNGKDKSLHRRRYQSIKRH